MTTLSARLEQAHMLWLRMLPLNFGEVDPKKPTGIAIAKTSTSTYLVAMSSAQKTREYSALTALQSTCAG